MPNAGSTLNATAALFISLWLFLAITLISSTAELVSNERPLFIYSEGRWLFPVLVDYTEEDLGGDFATAANYQDPMCRI